MAKKNLIKTIILVVIVGFLGFYVGIQYQMTQQKNLPTGGAQMPYNGANQQGQTGKQGNSMGAGPVSGEITALDGTTVTIKTQDGSSKIVIYSTSTKVNKTSEGSSSDLKVGEKVTAIGSTGTDGTITAQSISIGNGILQGMPTGGQLPGQNGGQPPSANTQ